MKRDEMMSTIDKAMATAGITDYVVAPTGGGHRKLTFNLRGRLRTIFFPSTPSDKRAVLNMRSFIRRKIRDVTC